MINGRSLVLCVEDDQDTQEMLSILVGARGYGFEAVDNCADALRLICDKNIALVLMDNLLPDGTGIELCRRVREFDKRLPIVFLSGSAFDGERDIALKSGANAFLTKPVLLDQLYMMLDDYAPL